MEAGKEEPPTEIPQPSNCSKVGGAGSCAIRLRSAARPVQKARKRSAELKELLEAAKKDWDTADYRGRREIQEVLKPKLPRGSIAETLRKQAGLAEACSSCGESSSTGHWCGAGCSGGFRGQS